MNLKVKKEVILPLLAQVQNILEKRSTLPIFSNVFIQAKGKKQAQILASDSEISFCADFATENTKEDSSMALSGKRLFEIVRELKDGFFEMKVIDSSQQIIIKQNSSLFKVHGLNPKDFPSFPELKKENKQQLKVGELLDMIDKTLYCISMDESRYHLTGVFLEQLQNKKKPYLRFVATDGHRMSFLDIKTDSQNEELKQGIIIPRKALQELKKMLSVGDSMDTLDIYVEKPRLLINFKNQSLNIRLIEGQYPNYKSLIPKEKGQEILINRADFLSALKRISVLTSARFKGVNFTFLDNKLSIYFSHPEVGEASEELACKYPKKEELKIRFNSKYILEILQSIQEERLKIILTDNRSPGLIEPGSDTPYTCLVMPMKL